MYTKPSAAARIFAVCGRRCGIRYNFTYLVRYATGASRLSFNAEKTYKDKIEKKWMIAMLKLLG